MESTSPSSLASVAAGVPRPLLFVVVALLGIAVTISRRPDAFFQPQFWAEDGTVFYAQAYNYGGLQAITIPLAGSIMLVPRLVALLALPFPLTSAPLIFNLAAIAIQVSPTVFLFTRRFDTLLPNYAVRVLLACLYLAFPSAFEIDGTVTNVQWHLVVLMFMIVVATPPKTCGWRTFDICVMVLAGLTGPQSIFVVPVAALYWWETRHAWTLLVLRITSVTSAAQLVTVGLTLTVLSGHIPLTATRIRYHLGPSISSFAHILAGQVIVGSTLGTNGLRVLSVFDGWTGMPVPLLLTVSGVALAFYTAKTAPLALRLFFLLGTLILASGLVSPMIGYVDTGSAWQVMSVAGIATRYEFVIGLAWLIMAVWLCAQNHQKWLRRVGIVILAFTVFAGIPANWRMPAFEDKQFTYYAAQFDQLPTGESITIPLNPDWVMTLIKH